MVKCSNNGQPFKYTKGLPPKERLDEKVLSYIQIEVLTKYYNFLKKNLVLKQIT